MKFQINDKVKIVNWKTGHEGVIVESDWYDEYPDMCSYAYQVRLEKETIWFFETSLELIKEHNRNGANEVDSLEGANE